MSNKLEALSQPVAWTDEVTLLHMGDRTDNYFWPVLVNPDDVPFYSQEYVTALLAALEEKDRQLKAWRASALMLGEDVDSEERRNKELNNYTVDLERQLQQPAIADVMAERQRQVSAEGWTQDHDDEHVNDEIAALAALYAMPEACRDWPAEETGYGANWAEAICPDGWAAKFGERRRDLVKAGALILAEIERLDRATAKAKGE